MKKSVTRIGAAILGLVILFGTMTAMASQLYPDLAPNHWCYKKIMEFVDKGYIDGYEDGTMRPDQTITRAEYVKVVNNFFGFKDGKTDKKFSDISDDAWYAKYVYAAVAQGYISGYEDNTFRPSNPITRQEATVILSRILKIDKEVYPKDHVDGLAQYSDGNEVADWAYTAIHSYSVYNFINGYEDGTLKILQNVTRAETVELLHVLEQKIEIDRPYGRTKTTKMPTINVIVEAGRNEFKPATTVNGWFNNENSCKSDDVDGVYVNITTTTDGATIYEKVNPRDPADRNYVTTTVNDFKNMFFLTDGVYDVSAYAKKTGRKTSGTNKVTLKIDTMAPYVEAKVLDNETNPKSNVAHTQKISVTLKDVIPSGLTEDKVSGVNEVSAKYTWFIESGEDGFVRVGEWTSLSNGQVVETPTKYGKYKLAVSVKDNAGNSFGEEYDGEIRYDFVEDGETTPSEDIVVEVGNNAPQAEDLVLSTKLGIVASGDIVAFDSDSGDKLTYTMETKPISGEATVDAVTGRVTYTPSEKGTFTFTVKVSDGNESGDTIATVTVTVEDLNYTVNYYLKGTTNKLATSKFVDNQFFSTKILAVNEAITIDGYNYDSADKEELIIGLNENVINLYYAKRTDLSYTVKYLEKETNKVLAPAKDATNQTFGDKITETAIEIDGYNKVAPTSGEVEITTGTNEITFYYEKKTDLSYTVKYLEKETNKVLAPAKVVENQTFGDKITETAIEIDGYNKVAPTSGEVEITTGENEITFYYEKRTDLSYTVKYLEKGTNKGLAPARVAENQTFGDKITESAIEIDGYNKIAPTSGEVEITTGTNEITFYYEKRTDLSYTVKYLEKETNNVLEDAKVVENQTFGDKITETAIEIDGYNKVAPTSGEVEITTGENEITFYYEKRTDLSYTVNYYLENTTTKVATSKTENGRTFEEEVTENAIDVAGYTKVEPTTKTITISADESKNVINFYYTKRTDLSYTVNYYLEGTTTKVATSKTVNGKIFEEEVTENAIDVAGYTKVAPTTKTITISTDESKNVINFYYTKRTDLSYTVNYYLEGTTTKVATSKTVNDKTFEEEVTENAIDVAGYTKVEPTTKTITISADESKNVINFYYTKRTDLSYTVNYYLEGTTTKVATSKTVNGKIFEEEVTENAIDVAGYTKVAPTTKTITISTDESKNVINFYYTKRTDLSYTVNYYLESTTTKVATSKTVNGKTFEEEVTENAIDVAGYTKVAPTTKTITISADESKNVINFYYKKNEGKLIANIKCNYPTKDGVKAEPGDTLKYKITLEEDGEAVSYPKTISIKLDADVEKPTNLPSNASYDETTHTITWTASTKDDKLTYNVKVKKETPAGSKADTIITGATANGATSVDIEATVAVKVDKNKNVVLVLDVSGSMDACVKHDKFFERKFMSSKIGHYYGLSFEECSEKSRLEVMQEAAKNFTKSIIDERNTEDITITIVTFGDSAVNKGTLKNPTAAQVNAVINKLSANGGTNMRGAIKGATQVLNSSKMLENAVDYVVVLSDGDPEANQYYCDTATLNAFYATKANAYAIGFGNNYKKDELLKIVNNDSSKLFDAADADKLEDAFRKIGSEINKAQTAEGKIDVNVTGIKLYPIKLTYKNKDSETVNVTVKDSSKLTSNNLSIVDGKLVWEISKYPGCTGFQVEVDRTKTTKTTATLMLLAEEYGLEDVILVYGDPTITDKLPEEIEDVSGEDEEIIDDTLIGPKQPVSGDKETKVSEETSGDTEIRPEKETSGDSEIQPTDETSGDPEKTEVDDKTSGDVEEKTEEVISGDTEPKPTEKTSGDSENKTEEKSDDKDIEPTQETSGNVAKEETKQQEKKTEEPKAEENEQQEEKTEEPKAEENKQQEDEKSEEIIEKVEEETKATVEEVVVPEIKDPLENEEKDEKAA